MTEQESIPKEPAPQQPTPEAAAPPSPFALLSTEPRSVMGASLDLATRAAGDLRTASFYIGLLVLGTAGPFALLLWGGTEVSYFEGSSISDRQSESLQSWLAVTGFLAVVGLLGR